jgi:hypothetical protein
VGRDHLDVHTPCFADDAGPYSQPIALVHLAQGPRESCECSQLEFVGFRPPRDQTSRRIIRGRRGFTEETESAKRGRSPSTSSTGTGTGTDGSFRTSNERGKISPPQDASCTRTTTSRGARAESQSPAKGRGGAQARGGKAAGTSAAGKRGGKAAAAAAAPKGKFKSAEIIEDSDDEDVDADGGNEMADEFARMVGESLAAAPSTEAEGEDEEEYEEEDDDEGELGGARLVVNDSGGGESSLALRLASRRTRADAIGYDDHSEWL